MAKFLVLYLVPAAVIDDWKRTDPDMRRGAEEKMRREWNAWMGEHAQAITGTEAAGRTKRVSAEGVTDARNDLMLYAFVEAESHDAAARMFARHPHLQIPRSSIEITEVRAMAGVDA